MFNKLKKTMTKKTTTKKAKGDPRCAAGKMDFAVALEGLLKKEYGYTDALDSVILLAHNKAKGVCYAWGETDGFVVMLTGLLKKLPTDARMAILTMAMESLDDKEKAAIFFVDKTLKVAKDIYEKANDKKVTKKAKKK